MKGRAWCAALVLAGCASTDARRAEEGWLDAQAAYARMKTLSGSYDVSAPEGGEPARITYEVTAGGHALLEKLLEGSPEQMISMYYLEGRDLALVHYCSAGNRPHMRLDRERSTIDDLRFEWDGTATDIDPTRDAHIHAARFRFKAATVESEWLFWQDGNEAHRTTFVLNRAPPSDANDPEGSAGK